MDNDKLDELERVAREATAGPWVDLTSGERGDSFLVCEDVPGRLLPICVAEHGHTKAEANATYIATFDPPTILALITAARRPALPDREAVAREVAPRAWEKLNGRWRYQDWHEVQQAALAQADAIIALFALSPAQAEREGWVLVPREPTREMVIAGQQAIPALPHFEKPVERREPDRTWTVRDQPWAYATAAYRAMLSAAPREPTKTENSRDVTMLPARELSDAELVAEKARVEALWDEMFNDGEFEGHGGSPGEWMAERLEEVQTAISRRADGTVSAPAAPKEGEGSSRSQPVLASNGQPEEGA